jgi:hypothetical protein
MQRDGFREVKCKYRLIRFQRIALIVIGNFSRNSESSWSVVIWCHMEPMV